MAAPYLRQQIHSGAVISFLFSILVLSFHSAENNSDQFNYIQQFLIHTVSCFNPLVILRGQRQVPFSVPCILSDCPVPPHPDSGNGGSNIPASAVPISATALLMSSFSSGDTRNPTVMFLQRFLLSLFFS